MWLCLSDGFLSVVKHSKIPNAFLIRSREITHLQKYFPEYTIDSDSGTDYRYRIIVPKEKFLEFLFHYVNDIKYTNFKSSVKNNKLHDFYMDIWCLGIKMFNNYRNW